MGGEVTRRDLVRGASAVGAAVVLGGPGAAARAMRSGPAGKRPAPARGGRFLHGVASGDPQPRSTQLWTRVDGLEHSGTLELEVARDPEFGRVVERRRVVARRESDYTVHAQVEGLKPDHAYWYRFDTGASESPVGRFRTLPPPGSARPIRIGVFSCQDWVPGFYTAHAGLAAEPDLDLVVCLGDYIYERTFYEPAVRQDTLGANGDGEVQTLKEYRSKYRLYHSDSNLREVRASFPLVAIGDDHEVEDNYAGGLPGDKTQDQRVPFEERRRNAFRAFFEYMPFSPVRPRRRRRRRKDGRFRTYRSLRIGENVELFLLDQRQYRDDQPCEDATFPTSCPPSERDDPSRTMLGPTQKEWLKRGLSASSATWKLVGTPLMMMSLDVPIGNPAVMDQWDGYGAERRELLEFVAAKGISNVSFLTGDIHTFFAGDVSPTGRQGLGGKPAAVATEFVPSSITSLGVPETVQAQTGLPLPPDAIALLSDSAAFKLQNPHYAYSETRSRGYGVVEAGVNRLDVTFRSPSTTEEPQSTMRTLGRFEVQSGDPRVELA